MFTGGTGFVGSHTVAALVAAGHRVRLLVRDPGKLERVFATRGIDVDDYVVGDVVDPGAVEAALEGCDAVVHAAAVVALEASRAQEVLATNARGVELVLGGAARRGLRRILYVSSVGALFNPGGPPVTLDSPLARVRNAYARSKTEGERIARRLQADGAPIHICYPGTVLGPDDPGLSEGNHSLQIFLRDTTIQTSSGYQLVDVRDLAALHVALLCAEDAPARCIAAGHLIAWGPLADLLDQITGARVRRVPIPGGLLRALGSLGDLVKRVRPFDFPLTREAMEFASRWPGAENGPGLAELGIALRAPEETLRDTIRWLHRAGHVEPERVGRLAEPAYASSASGTGSPRM